jgi:hypothetical protein
MASYAVSFVDYGRTFETSGISNPATQRTNSED